MANKRTTSTAPSCGKFKVELRGVGTRVVVIPEHITLEQVHDLVQTLFDWDGAHLWEFRDSAGRRYGEEHDDGWGFGDGDPIVPPSKACLSDVLPERGGKLRYTYDFGDGWEHVITRLADPKEPGCRCVKTEGPDGIEDVGGPWGLQAEKDEWHVPDADEITARLARLALKPRKSGTGLLEKESAELDDAIKDLTDLEWEWLCHLGEKGTATIWQVTDNIERLAGLLPGVRNLPSASLIMDGSLFKTKPEFSRLWRKKRDEWARLRGEPAGAETTAAVAKCPDDMESQLLDFARAAACLYGAVGEEDLLELFQHWRKAAPWLDGATRETASAALQFVRERMFSIGATAYFHDGLAISTVKYPQDGLGNNPADGALAKMLEARKDRKERWHPDNYCDFIPWGAGNGELPAEYGELKRFLFETWELDEEMLPDVFTVGDALQRVHAVLSSGRGWMAAFDVLRKSFDMSELDSREIAGLSKILARVSNATRHDANWGFTPDEMVARHGPDADAASFGYVATPGAPLVREVPQVGRNDPCPCGSGKKYKKCCGKDK